MIYSEEYTTFLIIGTYFEPQMNPLEIINGQNYPLHRASKDLDNLTPLMFAAKYGLSDYIDNKLSSIQDNEIKSDLLAITNEGGLTSLHFACLYGHVEAIKVLLKHGASISTPSKLGQLPIHSLFSQHNDIQNIKDIFTLLCKDNSQLLAANYNGDIVAHLAAQRGIVDILNYIYSIEPNCLNKKNNQSMTPLLLAVLNNQLDATNYLLNKSDITIRDNNRRNALHYAALYSTSEVLKTTLVHFPINSVDANQKKPLDYARANRNLEKITLLQEAEAGESKVNKPNPM